jgi:hypothetical protein
MRLPLDAVRNQANENNRVTRSSAGKGEERKEDVKMKVYP